MPPNPNLLLQTVFMSQVHKSVAVTVLVTNLPFHHAHDSYVFLNGSSWDSPALVQSQLYIFYHVMVEIQLAGVITAYI